MEMPYSYTTKEGEEQERKDKDKREDGEGGGCQDERSLADEEEIDKKLKGGERKEGLREWGRTLCEHISKPWASIANRKHPLSPSHGVELWLITKDKGI